MSENEGGVNAVVCDLMGNRVPLEVSGKRTRNAHNSSLPIQFARNFGSSGIDHFG
jgi:hypothetical protein